MARRIARQRAGPYWRTASTSVSAMPRQSGKGFDVGVCCMEFGKLNHYFSLDFASELPLCIVISFEEIYMNSIPDTRHTLLVRLRDKGNRQAWRSSWISTSRWSIALPGSRATARGCTRRHPGDTRGRGFGDRPMGARPLQGPFSGLAFRIAKNLAINALLSRRHRHGGAARRRSNNSSNNSRPLTSGKRAFTNWSTAGRPFNGPPGRFATNFTRTHGMRSGVPPLGGNRSGAAAERLGMTVGAVYAARSRILVRLREKIEQLESD